MNLSRSTLKNITSGNVIVPGEALLNLPEKVLQFGTGVLLRGLPDYFIDKANRQGVFNGRVVVVKSTTYGDTTAFDQQDGLYTLCVRGIQNGEKVEENSINSSISRVIDAHKNWEQVLKCAHNEDMQIVISNTTEVGIQLVNEDIRLHPPVSFPGKLLAFLHERYKAFSGSARSGMVIVPTELILNNGKKLKSIVLELAQLNSLEEAFLNWLDSSNHFCDSLVDRIVPGRPDKSIQAELEKELGYRDQLLIMSEVYRLWAIEGNDLVKGVLAFAQADEGVVIEPNIDIYQELKLRLLNGTHTLSCGLAFLAGYDTVREAMDSKDLSEFITEVMQKEIAPSIPYDVHLDVAQEFGNKVLDRFRNPHIKHQWINITVQYSSKMKMRCIPVLLKHYEQTGQLPELITLGFAAYLCFLRPVTKNNDQYFGELNGQAYPIQDDMAETFYQRWQHLPEAALVKEVLSDTAFWGNDLSALPGFEKAITEKMNEIWSAGMKAALHTTLNNNLLQHEASNNKSTS